jgi:hypothetical protein
MAREIESRIVRARTELTLILLTWTKWRAPTDASKWRMGFNYAFKGLKEGHLTGGWAISYFVIYHINVFLYLLNDTTHCILYRHYLLKHVMAITR